MLNSRTFEVDIFAPTHGILTAGGIVAFFLGSLMLFDTVAPVYRLSIAFILPGALLTAAFFIFVVGAGLRAQFIPVKVGKEAMIGRVTMALTAIDGKRGKVFIEGEYWNAVSDEAIAANQNVEIVSVEGLILRVKPKT
jgi:membrane-bound serine protease (ClpP class)